MSAREAFSYFTGIDYIKGRLAHQQNLLTENTGSDEPHLPFDGDLITAGRVYADRAKTVVGYPFVVASRVTGVAAALKVVRAQIAEAAKR